jgi:hypothetical protein
MNILMSSPLINLKSIHAQNQKGMSKTNPAALSLIGQLRALKPDKTEKQRQTGFFEAWKRNRRYRKPRVLSVSPRRKRERERRVGVLRRFPRAAVADGYQRWMDYLQDVDDA